MSKENAQQSSGGKIRNFFETASPKKKLAVIGVAVLVLLLILTAVFVPLLLHDGSHPDEGESSSTVSGQPTSSKSPSSSPAGTTSSVVEIFVPEDGKVDAVINIKDYDAVGDGVADDTAAFKQALSAAKSAKLPLYLPSGTYRLTSTIMLTSQTIVGYDVQNWPEDADKLPTILIDQTEYPGFAMTGAAISGVNITFKDINSKGPALNLIGTGSRVHNMKITNAPSGIVFGEATMMNPGRSNVENVIMEGIDSLGMYISGTMDVPYVGNVSVSGTSQNFKTNGRAFVLAQNDDIRMIGCSAKGANIGYQFTDLTTTNTGSNSSRSTWGSLIDCTAEDVNIGIDMISNLPDLLMAPLNLNRMNISAKTNAVRVNACRIQTNIVQSTLKSASGPALLISGGDGLIFSDCTIEAGGSADGVQINTTKNVNISQCTIKAGGRGVVANNCTAAVLVCNNTITSGGAKVVDNLPAGVAKAFNNNK